jgi:phosphoglycolate phosphatase
MLIPVDALLFDLDGTLIDSKRDLAHSVQYIQKRYEMPTSTEQQVGTFIGDGVVKLIQRALPGLTQSRLDEAVSAFKAYYREHCLDHTTIYPGVVPMLNHFHRKKMVVVTNKPVRISAHILDLLGLSPYFALVIGGDSLPNKKPHPEPILNALKTIGFINPKRAVVIGDSPNDVRAGRAAGTYTCGIRSNIADFQKLADSKPDYMIRSMKELTRFFK